MQKIILFILWCIPASLFAQTKDTTQQAKPFEPIQLYFVMLVKGNNRKQDSITAAKIQDGHMANITRLVKEGKMLVAGPFLDDTDWRGIFIMKCASKGECEKLMQTDPAIATGRLAAEIHPWMTGKNCLFQ
jgi:uncharacterized protein